KLDFSKVMNSLRELVNNLREEKYHKVLANYPNVEYIEGKGYFTSSNELIIENGDKFNVSADNIIIATGSSPSIPPIEGLDSIDYLTSNTIWQIDELPESIAIVGGGAIGLEIGQALLHFGSKVSVIEALDRIAYQAEPEISNALQNILEREGMEFHLRSRIAKINKVNSKVEIEVISKEGRKKISADKLLLATGRKANTKDLMLDKAGIDTENGSINVNSRLQTTNPRVYAAGDVIAKDLMLETLAAREGAIAAMNILGYNKRIDYNTIPWAIFTHPNVAGIGMSEYEVMSKYGACSCRILSLDAVPKAQLLNEEGLAKMIIHPKDKRILGMQVLAPYASEFITEVAVAMRNNLTFEDMIDITHVFPTISESIKLTAQTFVRDVRKMSCCLE
ncbi:MAG: mercury(II) reductase, partial [Candidatus Nitrosothermus koennekii]